jgi:hypothetical protein
LGQEKASTRDRGDVTTSSTVEASPLGSGVVLKSTIAKEEAGEVPPGELWWYRWMKAA